MRTEVGSITPQPAPIGGITNRQCLERRATLLLPWVGALVVLALGLSLTIGHDRIAAAQAGPNEAGILYVDREASGANDGSSWDDAFVDLQLALDAATDGDEIWVAAGTYVPSVEHGGTGDRFQSFQMRNGVGIYGGFDPSTGDVGWDDRDWRANKAILSGEIGVPVDPDDNSYHVFYHPETLGVDGTAILDGFTITKGNANGGGMHSNGGGMLNLSASPTVVNIIFSSNRAYSRGAGMYNEIAAPALSQCTFRGNISQFYGGGLFNEASSPTVDDCTFLENVAWSVGGGVANNDSSPSFSNCRFVDNQADEAAGGMMNWGGAPELANCAFVGNEASLPDWGEGGALANLDSFPVLTNCTFSRNAAGAYGGAILNADAAPLLTNCTFHANTAGEAGGAIFTYLNASLTLANCILWGDSPDEIIGGLPVVTYSDIEGGYDGDGNIELDPQWADPESGNYHLGDDSPCIDAGSNDAPELPPTDFEGNPRIMDGNDDGTPVVDMGIDEVYPMGQEPITGLEATNDGPTRLGEATALAATVETGNDISYDWAFGDDEYGSGKQVAHTYAVAGIYTAVVTATNLVSQQTDETAVTVEEAIDGLTATNDSPTALGSVTTLTATVETGTGVDYLWALGDGSYDSGQVVLHTYPALGTYTAVVTATNGVSRKRTGTEVSIEQGIEGLAATNDSPTLLGDTTTLTATITAGENVSYAWSFGDGEFGMGDVVSHIYPAAGSYTAIVTATNPVSWQSSSTLVTITSEVYPVYLPLVLRNQ